MDLDAKDALVSVAAFGRALRVVGSGRGGKPRDEVLGAAALAPYRHARGRKGKPADIGLKPSLLLRDCDRRRARLWCRAAGG